MHFQAELAFRCGDVILVYGDMDDDGFFLGELHGRRGLVPSNFLVDDGAVDQEYYNSISRDPQQLQRNNNASSVAGAGAGAGPGGQMLMNAGMRPSGPGAHGPPPPPRDRDRDSRRIRGLFVYCTWYGCRCPYVIGRREEIAYRQVV